MKLRTWCIRISQILTKTGPDLKTALLLLLVCCFSSFVSAEQGITIRQQNASLEKIFQSIEKQTGYRFFYNESLLNGTSRVSIDLRNGSLQEALEICFKGQPLTYSIVEKTIVVKRAVVARSASLSAPVDKIISVRGTVTSSGRPVEGATVSVKGTNNGTSTDKEGMFSLSEVDDHGILVISHVNHQLKEVVLGGQSFIAVDVNSKINDLDEAVVVAYNTTTTRRNTASISVVKGAEIQSFPNVSVDKSLQGLVPGLLVTSGTGQPGGGLGNFLLRGIATGDNGILGSTLRNPLIVLDGIPVTQDPQQLKVGYVDVPVNNPMAQLNPSDIETISVLKDAAAIALYGSKASNGVILITTKRGKSGKTVFNFNHQTDMAQRLKGKIEMLSRNQYLELLIETYKNSDPSLSDDDILTQLKSIFPVKADGSFYPETNLEDLVFRDNPLSSSTDISVSGGNEKSNFYLNLEYTKQNGLYKGTGFDRKSARLNFENRPKDWVRLGMNTTMSYNVQDYSAIGSDFPFGTASVASPLNPIRLEDGEYLYNYSAPITSANPIAAMELNSSQNIAFRGVSKVFAELSFLKWFKLSSNFGVDFLLTESKEKRDPRLFDEATYSTGVGRIQERDTRNLNLITTNILSFNKIFERSTLNILAGHEAQVLRQRYIQADGSNLRFPDHDQIDNTATRSGYGSASKQTLLSYFGQVNYDYRNTYMLSGSIRTDGSSKFGENQRFGTYWSGGLGWVVSNEQFAKFSERWLDYFKVRGSVGASGNSGTIDRFTRYERLQVTNYLNGQTIALYPTLQPANPDIKWEQTFSWDAGLELRLFANRIGVTADVYKRKTSDLVYMTNLALVSGYSSMLDNIGNIENKGIELSLNAHVIQRRDFNWELRANWSRNKNTLVKANIPLTDVLNVLANEEGRTFNSYYMPVWAGVNPDDGAAQWVDSTGKPNIDYNAAKRQFVGKPQPDAFGSLTSNFGFKNWQLSVMFYYQYGFQMYNPSLFVNDGSNPYANQDKRALDRWRKPGDIAANPKRTLYSTNAYYSSTRYLSDGDFLRLQNVNLSYTLPAIKIGGFGLSNARIYVQGNNLAIWTKSDWQDVSNVSALGFSGGGYPNQKTYSAGVNISF